LTSPFAPFLAEELYQNLNSVSKRERYESIHLAEFPKVGIIDEELEKKMDIVQRVVYLTRSMRAKSNLKVRQPLSKIIVALDPKQRDAVEKMKDVILDEVNIKVLEVLEDDSSVVNKTAKANFKSIGPKFGKMVKKIAIRISELTKEEISIIEKTKSLDILVDGENYRISSDDVEIISNQIEGWVVESEGGITVAIDSELTKELISEGYAREIVNRIQNMRKDSGYDVVDRIKMKISSSDEFQNFIKIFNSYIANETLADDISFGNVEGNKESFAIGDYKIEIAIEKV